jgi:hypothetical protein
MRDTPLFAFLEGVLDFLVQHGPLVVAAMVVYFAWKLIGFIRKS